METAVLRQYLNWMEKRMFKKRHDESTMEESEQFQPKLTVGPSGQWYEQHQWLPHYLTQHIGPEAFEKGILEDTGVMRKYLNRVEKKKFTNQMWNKKIVATPAPTVNV